jgi:hypothetical protein
MVESGWRENPLASLTAVENFASLETICLALAGMRARDEADSTAADIEADFPGLAQLVSVIRALADELSRTGSLTGHLGDPDLADTLDRVERNWHKQRVTLQTFLDSAADSVAVSLSAYQQLESNLAKTAGVAAD